jgi:hypothetical protein
MIKTHIGPFKTARNAIAKKLNKINELVDFTYLSRLKTGLRCTITRTAAVLLHVLDRRQRPGCCTITRTVEEPLRYCNRYGGYYSGQKSCSYCNGAEPGKKPWHEPVF